MTGIEWRHFEDLALQRRAHQKVVVPYFEVPHPSADGYDRSQGEPDGQDRDWRRTLPDGRGIHIQEFVYRYYLIHWDWYPPENPLGHLLVDAPEVPAAVATGGTLGYLAADAYYQKAKDSSEHPVLESVLVGIGVSLAVGGATYLAGRAIREYSEGSSSAQAQHAAQPGSVTFRRARGDYTVT